MGYSPWGRKESDMTSLSLSSQKSSKKVLDALLWEEPRLLYASLLFHVFSLFLHSFPSLISNCLNLPFGTQGRSWRLESVPYKQETGNTGRLRYSGDP